MKQAIVGNGMGSGAAFATIENAGECRLDIECRIRSGHHRIMSFVSITRLRIRSLRFMPQFIFYNLRTMKQVKRASGFLGGSLLADRKLAFWTMTLWREQADMRRYMTSGSHLKAMPKLLHWCDEASIVHWVQDDATAPDWREADRRMRAEGRPSKVRRPSAHHDDLTYSGPRTTGALPLVAVETA